MLQTQTVEPQLMELLRSIREEKLFAEYNLVGGTALALQIGHRNSIVIDMFGSCEIQTDVFTEELSKLGSLNVIQNSPNVLITQINGIKIDFVNYKFPLLEKPLIHDGIRILQMIDIAAMKINSIAGRGSKKDFIDLYFLLKEFSLAEMLSFYQRKYSNGSVFLAQKSLTYFEDAERQPQPKMLAQFDWNVCKQTFLKEVKNL